MPGGSVVGAVACLLASLRLARLANTFAQTPGLRGVAKSSVGMSPAREIPASAPQTYRESFRTRPSRPPGGCVRVVLWDNR